MVQFNEGEVVFQKEGRVVPVDHLVDTTSGSKWKKPMLAKTCIYVR